MEAPFFVTADEVIALNRAFVTETGEPFQIRSMPLLESACSAPINQFVYGATRHLDQLGLGLAMSIARNHPFAQGNKRTGWGAMLLFWELNGLELINEDHAYYADIFVDVITGETDPEALLAQLTLMEI